MLWVLIRIAGEAILVSTHNICFYREITKTSWLLKEAKFGRSPLIETTIPSLSSARCAPFWEKVSGVTGQLNGMSETSPDVTYSFTWHYWTVSPGVNGPYHLTLLDSFTWRYWTASPDVTRQFHLALLDRITWRYWTVSLVITEPHHLMLLDSFTWRYWTVSPDVTGQFHLPLLNLLDSFTLRYWNLSPDVTGQQSNCSICNDQLFN